MINLINKTCPIHETKLINTSIPNSDECRFICQHQLNDGCSHFHYGILGYNIYYCFYYKIENKTYMVSISEGRYKIYFNGNTLISLDIKDKIIPIPKTLEEILMMVSMA